MVMTNEDFQQHADSLREMLHRKTSQLWDCQSPEGCSALLAQMKALRNRISELDQQTR